ncbi:MAG: FHA domain-containing protein [Planctomycetota bacterium]|nr:MAG: FHA domain-containing protein [Planctomycetota bacterium]
MPILRVKNGPQKGLEVELTSDHLIIGRDEIPGGLQILDQGISRRHAEVFRIGEMYFIRDLGSRNGSYVNEERITEELLRVGDEIKIGSTVCLFEDRRPSERNRARRPDPAELDQISATTTIRLDLMDDGLIAEPVEETTTSRDLQILYKVAKTIASERDIKGLARKVVKLAVTAVDAEQGYMFIKHPDRGELTLAASHERSGKGKEQPLVSRAIIKRVLKFNRGVLTSDASTDDRFKNRGSVVMKGIRSVICAPLVAMDQICGVLYLSTGKVSEAFDTDDLDLVTTIGIQAGMAVQGITLSLAQEKNYLELVSGLVRAIEMRDPISRGHSERVATYSSGIAQALGLSRSRNRRVQLAALLHNIGLLFLDPEEAARSTEEPDIDKRRIDLACQLLEGIQGMSFLLPAVRHHRERWDGSGYPDGLAGEDIPLEARIISVANDFDLLLERSAEQGEDLPTKDAVAKLVEEGQDRYDPRVLEALLTAHREGWLYKPQERVKVG